MYLFGHITNVKQRGQMGNVNTPRCLGRFQMRRVMLSRGGIGVESRCVRQVNGCYCILSSIRLRPLNRQTLVTELSSNHQAHPTVNSSILRVVENPMTALIRARNRSAFSQNSSAQSCPIGTLSVLIVGTLSGFNWRPHGLGEQCFDR